MILNRIKFSKRAAFTIKSILQKETTTASIWTNRYYSLPFHFGDRINIWYVGLSKIFICKKTLKSLNAKRKFSTSHNLKRLTIEIYRHDTSTFTKLINKGYHRYLILLLIIFIQMSNKEEVELTGRVRIVPFSNQDPTADIEMGRALIKEMIDYRYGGRSFANSKISEEREIQRKVQERFDHLTSVVRKHFSASQSYTEWEVFVVPDPTVNAACLPGGKMVVHTGLLEWAEIFIKELNQYHDSQLQLQTPLRNSEEQYKIKLHEKIHNLHNLKKVIKATPMDIVDIVLAHEMAHAFARHSSENIGSLNAVVATFINLLGAWTNSPLLNSISSFLLELPYSRTLECEADHIGMIILSKACRQMELAPVVYGSLEGDEIFNFLSTHPQGVHRYNAAIEKVEQIKKQHKTNEHCEAEKKIFNSFLSEILTKFRTDDRKSNKS